jgi:hypothetical protein
VAKRPISLIATVLVLFGMQVPLCALACAQGADAESIADHQAEPPCHQQSSDSPASEAPRSEGECDCEFAYEAPLPSADSISNYGSLGFLLVGAHGRPPHSSVRRARGVLRSTDLPPPDILLLKSTLLI